MMSFHNLRWSCNSKKIGLVVNFRLRNKSQVIRIKHLLWRKTTRSITTLRMRGETQFNHLDRTSSSPNQPCHQNLVVKEMSSISDHNQEGYRKRYPCHNLKSLHHQLCLTYPRCLKETRIVTALKERRQSKSS